MNKNSWKMRCVDGGNSRWEVGNIIVVKDNKGTNDEYKVDGDFSSFEDWCEERKRLGSKWELIEDSFTKSDLKPCMIVKLRDDSELYIVTESKKGFVLTSLYGHMSLNSYNEDMLCVSGYNSDREYDIIEVYSLRDTNYHANEISTDNRDLLFKRIELSSRDIKIKELQDKMDAVKREMEELK